MKVLFINESDYNGGAARAMYRLSEALISLGIDTGILVGRKTLGTSNITLYEPGRKDKLFSRLSAFNVRYIKGITDAEKIRFYYRSKHSRLKEIIYQLKPDIIHLHWFTENFLDLDILKDISIPVVWTLHDMWAFTGGCDYSGDCIRYSSGCGSCPKLESGKINDKSKRNYERKNELYKSFSQFNIITPSNWMQSAAMRSKLLGNCNIHHIPNCIDTTKYKPVNKEYARAVLNIHKDRKVLLFVAAGGTGDERKGFYYTKSVFDLLDKDKHELVVVGGMGDPKYNNSKIRYMNKLVDDYSLALIYGAADILLASSLQENLANTIMESLSCGTPVAAFNTGGNPDLIEHLNNGYLAEPFSVSDLLKGANTILCDKAEWDTFSANARSKVEKAYSYNIIAKKHIELYSNILNKGAK